jgi:hypothetical protein
VSTRSSTQLEGEPSCPPSKKQKQEETENDQTMAMQEEIEKLKKEKKKQVSREPYFLKT